METIREGLKSFVKTVGVVLALVVLTIIIVVSVMFVFGKGKGLTRIRRAYGKITSPQQGQDVAYAASIDNAIAELFNEPAQ